VRSSQLSPFNPNRKILLEKASIFVVNITKLQIVSLQSIHQSLICLESTAFGVLSIQEGKSRQQKQLYLLKVRANL
jgi:hypothetical protein